MAAYIDYNNNISIKFRPFLAMSAHCFDGISDRIVWFRYGYFGSTASALAVLFRLNDFFCEGLIHWSLILAIYLGLTVVQMQHNGARIKKTIIRERKNILETSWHF